MTSKLSGRALPGYGGCRWVSEPIA